MARARLGDRRAQRPQRVVAGLAREPAADLDDGQHERAQVRGRELGERGRGRRVALAPRSTAARPRGGRGAPPPRGRGTPRRRAATTGAASAMRAPTCRAAASIWRTCSAWRYAAIASTSAGESCSMSAQTSRATRSRAHSTLAAPPVRRRAGVGLGREVPEDQVHVGADREQLRRDRAPAPADRDARGDRREVRAQRAGVDELARQQPVEVAATARRRRGRPRSGSRRRSCCRRRAAARPGAARRPRGRSPPSWRRRRRAAAPAPRRGSRARPRS